MQQFEEVGEGVADGGSVQVPGSFGETSPGTETGVDVEFEMVLEALGGVGEIEGGEQADQGFDGGEVSFALLFTEPVTAGAGEGQTDGASPRFEFPEHLPGLIPTAVKQQYLDAGWVRAEPRVGPEAFATRMQDPEFAGGIDYLAGLEGAIAVEDVGMGVGEGASDEFAGARGPPLFASMEEDIDAEGSGDGIEGGADAPARGDLAAGTSFGAGEDDAARHGRGGEGPQRMPKRYSVVERNSSPGRRTVEGKWGWLGESGKCWVSRQNPP